MLFVANLQAGKTHLVDDITSIVTITPKKQY